MYTIKLIIDCPHVLPPFYLIDGIPIQRISHQLMLSCWRNLCSVGVREIRVWFIVTVERETDLALDFLLFMGYLYLHIFLSYFLHIC